MNRDNDFLSLQGLDRRDAILRDAIRAARGRRRGRSIRAAAVAGTVVLVSAGALWNGLSRGRPSDPSPTEVAKGPTVPDVAPVDEVAPGATVIAGIPVVPTDPAALERYAGSASPLPVQEIDADQLLALLDDAQEPGGIAQVGGQLMFVGQ